MKLTLKNITNYEHGMMQLSIHVEYGFQEKNYSDIIKLNINKEKKNMHITVKIENPGIGQVVDRIAQLYIQMDQTVLTPQIIIEKLIEDYMMDYDPEVLKKLPIL